MQTREWLREATRAKGRDGELANAVSGRQKHPVRSAWIAAAALGRANPLGHLTKLPLPLADGTRKCTATKGRPYSGGRTRPGRA